ncbi:MAG: type II secretion system protein [Symploca sp. SIO2E9]|nr:type II secretion system protein [Symploca sp. SIO2E9]
MFTRKRLKLLLQLHNSQSGFTIMESLLAIMVVAILMTSIAPVLVLSVATRMQAKRVEWGAQAASSYIDGIKSGAITPPKHLEIITKAPEDDEGDNFNVFEEQLKFAEVKSLEEIILPACDNLTANDSGYCVDTEALSLYCVDLDNDGGCSNGSNKDLIIQAFRSAQETQKGYLLGIRVYRANAFDGKRELIAGRGETESTFTGGTGLNNKEQAPLVELSTEISGDENTLSDYCDRLGCG